MSRIIGTVLLAFLGVCASTVLASAQATPSPTETDPQSSASSTPVAFVYITSSPSSGVTQINGYAAAANGALTKIPGTPLSSPVSYVAVNGKWLFGTDGMNIDTFSIAADGSLAQVQSLSVEPEGGLVNLFLDHTGASLYTDYYTTNNEYMAYGIDNSNGALTYIDNVMGGPGFGYVASFVGDDEFAYEASCYQFTPEIYGVQRSSSGAITMLDVNSVYPTAPSGDFWCPWSAAADPTNHLAVAMQPLNGNWFPEGPYQLATYTVDSAGQLSTTSTYENMPTTEAGGAYGSNTSYLNDYWMSPSGKFLAVAGTSGLQVFHFNGANPITKYTGLLVSKDVDQVFWDNSNHLYAIGREAGKLWVFTVTATSVKQAPGSPHSITGPSDMIVLPK
jgi:hypothetical protein